MDYVASENIRRFRALLDTPLPPERRKTIEALLAAELAEAGQERSEGPTAARAVRGGDSRGRPPPR